MPGPWELVPRATLLEVLAPALAAGGDRPAVIFDDGFELSCAALVDRAERFAGALATRIGPGDRVAVAVGNRAEFLVAYLAILAVRATMVAFSPEVRAHDAAHMVRLARCAVAVAEPEAAATLDRVAASTPTLREVLLVSAGEPDGLAAYDVPGRRVALSSVRASPEELTDIGFTSGTTGLPKALAGDHTELLWYGDLYLRAHGLGPDERILCPLRFHYGDPLWLFLISVVRGSPLVVMRRFSVSRFWAVARRFDVTQVFSIGSIPNLLLTAAPVPAERDHGVRLAASVAVPASQHRELEERFGFPWVEIYGSSEAGPALAMPPASAPAYVGTGAIGIPYPEIEARLVDVDGAVVEGPGEGELELAGHVLFTSYLDDPAATAEVLHDGWLRTGDLARRDEHGVYSFAGRRKELIRRGGENVAPAEVEAVLRTHPDVVDAAVVPVADELWGEEVKAYVELRPGIAFDPAALAAFCAERLAPPKVPRYLELREAPFPRTPSQRIPKAQLAVDGAHGTAGAWDRSAAASERS